jgi:hypothetical protein
MTNEAGPSAREDSAYGFSANERAHIVRGMCDEEQAPMAVNVLSEEVAENVHLAPRCQLDFKGWVQKHHLKIFGVEIYPTGAKIVKAPLVPGMRVYALEAFGGYYYGAWSELSGLFTGWLHIEATRMGKASMKFAVGEVGGKPVFGDMFVHRARRSPLSNWIKALKVLDYEEVV